jgi:hypothetical protein
LLAVAVEIRSELQAVAAYYITIASTVVLVMSSAYRDALRARMLRHSHTRITMTTIIMATDWFRLRRLRMHTGH